MGGVVRGVRAEAEVEIGVEVGFRAVSGCIGIAIGNRIVAALQLGVACRGMQPVIRHGFWDARDRRKLRR